MRNPGLEPGSLAALEPESSASANSASSACKSFWRQFVIISQPQNYVNSYFIFGVVERVMIFPRLYPVFVIHTALGIVH
jgi:hypothetical protein